jgi:hypothetical protein
VACFLFDGRKLADIVPVDLARQELFETVADRETGAIRDNADAFSAHGGLAML